MKSNNIDVIITWVDGNDPKWKQEFLKYKPHNGEDEVSVQKFRDWDTLRYVFRGIEKFMPWVRKIHFVTYGHLPLWMDENHPKLNIVKHKDMFSNQSHLPTFSSNALEFHFLGIKDLAEKFIYFNDDMLVLQPTKDERFFYENKPRDFLIQTIPRRGWIYYRFFSDVAWRHNINNNISLINRHFNKKSSIKENKNNYYNPTYGKLGNLKNWISNCFSNYHYFEHYHQAQPYLKSTLVEVNKKCSDAIMKTSANKFRKNDDITSYIYRYWHLVKGDFSPLLENDFKIFDLINIMNIEEINNILLKDKYRFVCLNDMSFTMDDITFDKGKKLLHNTLDKILPQRSQYEI